MAQQYCFAVACPIVTRARFPMLQQARLHAFAVPLTHAVSPSSLLRQVAVHIGPHQVRKGDRGLVVVGASLESGDVVSGEGLEGGFADDDILLEEMRTEEEEASHAKSAGAGSGDCWWWVGRSVGG